jgi:putative ABC transport system permease protein
MPIDVRYAFRGLARNPGFAIMAILTLALGIGAVTSIFSVADAVLLRPLPFPNQDRLVMVWDQLTVMRVEHLPLMQVSYDGYRNLDIFEETGVFWPLDRTLTGGPGAEEVSTMMVSDTVLPMLGASLAHGRAFDAEEYRTAAAAVILGYTLFERRFGGDPSIVGRTIILDGIALKVIGVMAPGFDFNLARGEVDLWTPMIHVGDPHRAYLRMIARLRPGVSIEAAQAAVDAAVRHLIETDHPHYGPNGEDPGFRARVISLRDQLLGDFRQTTLILLSAVAALLLIACVNVANLLLVRAVAREKETTVRRALGASNGQLIRQWTIEAALLALLGGAVGAILARWGVPLLVRLSPVELPAIAKVAVDARTLLFTLAISIGTCIFFGLAPLSTARLDWRGARPKRAVAPVLIAVEVAIATILLVASGLLVRSFSELRRVDPGFKADHLLTFRLQYAPARPVIRQRASRFLSDVQKELASLPGVVSASAIDRLPAGGSGPGSLGGNPFSIEGRAFNSNSPVPQLAHTQGAGVDYFKTLGIPLIEGRTFTDADTDSSPHVAVVNQTLARGFFPHGAIGHRIMIGAPQEGVPWLTIVGVVGDVKTAGLDQKTMPQFYYPFTQDPAFATSIVLRIAGDPQNIVREVSATIHRLDPEMPVFQISTMEDRIARAIGQPKFETILVGMFAIAALFLAAIGIFGVVAHSTEQRTQEIGIRMALGADSGSVLRHILAIGFRPVLAGLIIGFAGALAATRLLASVLFHVTATDPATFGISILVLAAVAILACLGPARRATRVDPMVALRAE